MALEELQLIEQQGGQTEAGDNRTYSGSAKMPFSGWRSTGSATDHC
jgi:hypothetical protein